MKCVTDQAMQDSHEEAVECKKQRYNTNLRMYKGRLLRTLIYISLVFYHQGNMNMVGP